MLEVVLGLSAHGPGQDYPTQSSFGLDEAELLGLDKRRLRFQMYSCFLVRCNCHSSDDRMALVAPDSTRDAHVSADDGHRVDDVSQAVFLNLLWRRHKRRSQSGAT